MQKFALQPAVVHAWGSMPARTSPHQSKHQSPCPAPPISWISEGLGVSFLEYPRFLATCLLLVGMLVTAWAWGHHIIEAGTKWTVHYIPTAAGNDLVSHRSSEHPIARTAHGPPAETDSGDGEDAGDLEYVAQVVNYEDDESFSLDRDSEVKLTVSYKSTGAFYAGLFNQHIAHEHGFMLAVALKADTLMWPPSRERRSYNANGNKKWKSIEATRIYDVEHIQRFAKEKYGMAVVAVPSKGFRHELQQPTPSSNVGGYVTLLDSAGKNVPGKQVLLDVAIHEGHHHLRKVAEHANEKIRELLDRWGGDVGGVPEVAVVLDAPFFMLSHVPRDVAVPVMTNLLFAPSLRALADEAVRAVKDKTGSESFNGLHLRVEDDAAAYVDKVRGDCGILVLHNRAMAKAGFSANVPVLVASAIFSVRDTTPGNLEKAITYSADLICEQYASKILTKDMLLPWKSLKNLGPEELAVVDWLILKQAHLAVGWAASTFSLSLRERRVMEGAPEATTRLVKFNWSKDAIQVPAECRSQPQDQHEKKRLDKSTGVVQEPPKHEKKRSRTRKHKPGKTV